VICQGGAAKGKLGAGGGVMRAQSVTIPARAYLAFGAAEVEVTWTCSTRPCNVP
jgi:hypothetical protein